MDIELVLLHAEALTVNRVKGVIYLRNRITGSDVNPSLVVMVRNPIYKPYKNLIFDNK